MRIKATIKQTLTRPTRFGRLVIYRSIMFQNPEFLSDVLEVVNDAIFDRQHARNFIPVKTFEVTIYQDNVPFRTWSYSPTYRSI